MSINQKIRGAVMAYLREQREPSSISVMAEQIRLKNAELNRVPDFDFRATVLRMIAIGDIESTVTSRISLPQSAFAARG